MSETEQDVREATLEVEAYRDDTHPAKRWARRCRTLLNTIDRQRNALIPVRNLLAVIDDLDRQMKKETGIPHTNTVCLERRRIEAIGDALEELDNA